jgi:hypothetical protein
MKLHEEMLKKAWNSGKEKISNYNRELDIMNKSKRRIEITLMKQE